MTIKLRENKGYPLERQLRNWKKIVLEPISKLDTDAFARLRIILMSGIEAEALRFSAICSQMNEELREPLAEIRRIEQQQAMTLNWLMPADQSSLETSIALEQTGVEISAALAQNEPDPYLAQAFRFGMLEDLDHLYRFSALIDRLQGQDPNTVLQSYTDILPGRPTMVQHRDPMDDLRRPYLLSAEPLSKINSLTLFTLEYRAHDYYMHVGPQFADPLARQLFAEIASLKEQHLTHYGSLISPQETWLEKWLLHEITEAQNYYACLEAEKDPLLRSLWAVFLDYELGHLNVAMEAFIRYAHRDPMDILPEELFKPVAFESQREFVRKTLKNESGLSSKGIDFLPQKDETLRTRQYRQLVNESGSPSEQVAQGYRWTPGTELKWKGAPA